MEIKKGDWVKVYSVVLKPDERAPQVPDDTKKVPLEMWVKGYAMSDAKLGDTIEVKTMTGRIVKGEIVEVNPTYKHSYGEFVPELLEIGQDLRKILFEKGDSNE